MLESRWMTVRKQMMAALIFIFLIPALTILFVYIQHGLDTGWVLLFVGLSVVYVLAFGLWFLSLFKHTLNDTSKKFKVSIEPAQTALDRALIEANLVTVRRKNRRVLGRPKQTCDVEYDVRSEGLRIGVDRTYDHVTVYLGPVGEFNSKEINRMKVLIDGALG